jgi:medium-chain acyl-[acyl-carrier-protein] hydrolase
VPGAQLRLFCLAHAGGGASTYRGWADGLPPQVEVCPVQLPGRENRIAEKPFERLGPLVEALAEVLEGWRDLPFAVFGHSNGALIGFELARHLRRVGRPGPVHLFASGRRAPDVPSRYRDVHALPEPELIADLRELGGIPEGVLEHPEMRALLLPLFRADMALTETYGFTEEAPLDVPITAYGGLTDNKVTREDIEAWGRHTAAGFRVRFFPGDHFFILGDRQKVLHTLSADLLQLLRGEPLSA